MKKIVLCGGGTAGHVYPALAVAEKLKGFEIHFIGSDGMEKEILKSYPNIVYHQIPTVKLQRKLTLQNLLIPFKLFTAIKMAKAELKKYVSVPVAIAGKKLGIPVISHESDLSLGLANKIILRYCNVMCTSFEKTAEKNSKCVFTGQPIRSKILNGKKLELDFDNTRPTVLFLGGSLGAKFLNDIVFNNLDKILKHYNILHISGKKNFKNITRKNYKQVAYADNIEDLYKSADVVVCRSGSGVINELLSLEKPMLLIPLSKKASRGDQIENAKIFEENGYAICLCEEDYTFDKFMKNTEKIIKNKENFIKSMKKTTKNDAVSKICEIIEKNSIE